MAPVCQCGCNQPVPIAKKTDNRYGRIKGRPTRFVSGHNTRARHAAANPPAKVGPGVRCCARCPYPLALGRAEPLPGWRRHQGRGLCTGCYDTATRTGELIDFERPSRTRDEILDEWVILRAEGYTRAQAANRLAMSSASFERAYFRARRDGDPRALPALGGERRAAS